MYVCTRPSQDREILVISYLPLQFSVLHTYLLYIPTVHVLYLLYIQIAAPDLGWVSISGRYVRLSVCIHVSMYDVRLYVGHICTYVCVYSIRSNVLGVVHGDFMEAHDTGILVAAMSRYLSAPRTLS